MSDRRRNAFILLLVAGLIAASIGVIATTSTKLGLDLKGGVELVYQAKPTKFSEVSSEAVERSIDIMRERVDELGVAEPEIQRQGEDQIIVSLPDVDNAEEAQRQVGTTAQLFFYDWEANVLGPDLEPDPSDTQIHGGQAAGQVGCIPQYDAVARARRRAAMPNQNTSTGGPRYYLVNDESRTVVSGPEAEKEDLFVGLDRESTEPRENERIVTVKEGTVVLQAEQPEGSDDNETERDCYYVLNDDFALRGTDIKNPEQNFDSGPGGSGAPNVTFEFSDDGRKIWQDVTREIAERGQSLFIPGSSPLGAAQHFAIVLDGEIISTPYIDFQRNPDGIDARTGSEISGGFTIDSAQRLANLLRTGALPIELELISQSQVSATLGEQALDEGLIAGAAGFIVVVLFLLAMYRVLGVIAAVALCVYGAYFFALIKLIPVTLTLPGIAGLVLTLGVAADANIVIFERVKEEVRAGRSVMAAVSAGYKKGITAVIDANVVVFMVAFILFVLATAGVKGFALVLGIGTLVSLFTAVLLTQAILGTLSRSKLLQAPSALGTSPDAKPRFRYDYAGLAKWFFSGSGLILVVGALALGGMGLNFGIDFESGTRITVAFEQQVDDGDVRDALGSRAANAQIQQVTDEELGDNAFLIQTEELAPAEVTVLTNTLDEAFTLRGPPDTQSIGPTFGESIAEAAIIAVIASLLVISAYIALRFEWKYAVPVLIASTHDILIVAGIYALTDREVTTSTVAALLTLLGYSLYDTIIVFDRIRENIPRMPRAAFSQIVNRSMSEVITRSIATSVSTALPVLALFLFGGETLQDFAFALLVGVISGTYSSIFIAAPVLTEWKEREPVYRRRRLQVLADNDGVVPAYVTATADADVDTRAEAARKRRAKRVTQPDDPSRGVSKEEFDEMVRDLHIEDEPVATEERDPTADATPEDLVMKDDSKKKPRDKSNRKRNPRHGRPR